MENASKALIIAGSILVAILLVTAGVILISQSRGTSDNAKNTTEQLNTSAENQTQQLKDAINTL